MVSKAHGSEVLGSVSGSVEMCCIGSRNVDTNSHVSHGPKTLGSDVIGSVSSSVHMCCTGSRKY